MAAESSASRARATAGAPIGRCGAAARPAARVVTGDLRGADRRAGRYLSSATCAIVLSQTVIVGARRDRHDDDHRQRRHRSVGRRRRSRSPASSRRSASVRGWPARSRPSPPGRDGRLRRRDQRLADHARCASCRSSSRSACSASRAAWRSGWRDEQTVNVPSTWVNDLLVTFPTPAWLCSPSACGSRSLLAVLAAVVLQPHGVRPAHLRARARTKPQRARAASHTGRLESPSTARRAALRTRRRDADVAAAPGRSDRRQRRGARHHRRGRDRRRQPQSAARAASPAR